ncbi:MAG: agmatine deiminase family protein [Saprospiraceae bacterium]|nr:agmatine deiminase family protein [Saprospiraceae bacterium]
MKKILLPLFLIVVLGQINAQIHTDLPRFLSEEEKHLEKNAAPASPIGITDPPALPVRSMAEWEELQALVITWRSQPAILTEIVRAAREECRVVIACNSTSDVTAATNYLLGEGVDLSSNVEFVVAPSNSIWVRDYGPNCVYANDVDSLYFVDWRYNRTTRPKDDTIATTLAPYFGIPLYSTSQSPTDLVHTGGNFMADGMNTAFSSSLILNENEPGNPYGVSVKNEAQINQIMADFMGINRYIKMDPLPYDVIHHIDMHMKLLDEETLLVGEYPEGVADGPQIEANIQYVLSNFQSSFGTPYKVIRIPMPPDAGDDYPNTNGDYRTYANAVFVNKTVIVPFYEFQYDTTAQRIWEESLPGYNIVGVDCNSIIPSLGAIHCITKEVGVADPLRIVHQEIQGCLFNTDYPNGYPVWATIQHRSGIADARLFYKTSGTPWSSVGMTPLLNDTVWSYIGYIPPQSPGEDVYYYIQATANSGKVITRPLPGPDGPWSFCASEYVNTTEVPDAGMLSIYPNPASAITCIPVESSYATDGAITLINTLGQTVQTIHQGKIPSGKSNYFFDAGKLPSGTYFVELRTGNKRTVKKVMVR